MRYMAIRIICIALGLCVIAGTGLLAYQVSDRSPAATDATITLMPTIVEQGETFQIDVRVFYRRSCLARIIRRLYDTNGERYAVPELNLPPSVPGLQHSVTTIAVAPNFAVGEGRYISTPLYSCNWFQRVFWPIQAPDRVAAFQVVKRRPSE